MELKNLGNSGLKVSAVGLGCMNMGMMNDEAQSQAVVEKALDLGVTLFDTADIYGNRGQSEEWLGKALGKRRPDVVVATKFASAMGDGDYMKGGSRRYIMKAVDASLSRLSTDYIDLYQMHAWDPDTPIEETMATLDSFVQAGKVRYIGCSNYTGSQIVEAQWAASRQKGTPFIALQPRYSLLARDIEADVLPACQRHGLGTLVYSPLAGGMLTGKYKQGEEPAADTRFGRRNRAGVMGTLNDRNFEIVNAVEQAAGEIGATASAVSIAWCLTRRGVTSVIIGPRTLQQQEECLEGYELELSEMLVKGLSDASRPAGRR